VPLSPKNSTNRVFAVAPFCTPSPHVLGQKTDIAILSCARDYWLSRSNAACSLPLLRLRYMPKVGPFKGLAFNKPTPQTEDLYIKSINTTVDQYRAFLEDVRTDTLVLADCDLDSGKATKAAEYSLTDVTYAKLLARLADHKFDLASPELRDNILRFYADLSVPIETKKDKVRWQAVLTELDQLRAVATAPTVADSLTQ
jgi:hypothetical protein